MNYSIDTEKRKKNMEKRRSYGWENKFYDYRRKWDERPFLMDEGEYPLDLLVEPIWACNLKCPMCPRNSDRLENKRANKLFDIDVYKKIIEEVGNKVPSVRLAGLGEATLHPQFLKFIEIAKKGGIGEVSLVTNGGTIDEDYFTQMVLAGLDWISISIDGRYDMYEKVRYPLKFEDTVDRLKMMMRVRERLNSVKPVIWVQGLWKYILPHVEEYYNIISPYCDYIQMQSYIDLDQPYGNWDDDKYCNDVFRRLYINVDGDVYPCCDFCDDYYYENAKMGNVLKESIYDIWHSKKLNKLRDMQREGKSHQGYCASCCALRKMRDAGNVVVNGRKITVREYVYDDERIK